MTIIEFLKELEECMRVNGFTGHELVKLSATNYGSDISIDAICSHISADNEHLYLSGDA